MTKRSSQWLAVLSASLGMLLSVPVLAECDDSPKPQVDWTKCTKMRLVLTNSDLSGAKLERTNLSSTRITSYNVCYTKLLRK